MAHAETDRSAIIFSLLIVESISHTPEEGNAPKGKRGLVTEMHLVEGSVNFVMHIPDDPQVPNALGTRPFR